MNVTLLYFHPWLCKSICNRHTDWPVYRLSLLVSKYLYRFQWWMLLIWYKMPIILSRYTIQLISHMNLFADILCPSGWRENNGFCYYIFAEYKTQSEAHATCIQYSAALVSITSPEETQFIKRLNFSVTNATELLYVFK